MASVPFPGVWNPNASLSSDAAFALDQNDKLWVISESGSDGVAIFSSTDYGVTFTRVISVPLTITTFAGQPISSAIAQLGPLENPATSFDPALTIDSNGTLYFIGQVNVAGVIVLAYYTYVPGTNTLTGPIAIDLNIVHPDYDIITLANGNCYLAATGSGNLSTSVVFGLEIAASGSQVSRDDFVGNENTIETGKFYGGLSLFSPDGSTVEVYCSYHPARIGFTDSTLTIASFQRTENNGVSSFTGPAVLISVPMRHTSHRLTVIGDSTNNLRYLSESFFSQSNLSLVGNALLGYAGNGPDEWSFATLRGDSASWFYQPTLSVSSNGLVLSYISANPNQATPDALVKTVDLDPTTWNQSARVDFPYQAPASWLRGTNQILPSAMPWGFIAETTGGVGRFYTGYDSPPFVTLLPESLTAKLGETYTFDASQSFSPNLDALEFSWTITDPSGLAQFSFSGATALLMLPESVGPDTFSVTVTVAVTAVDADGNPLHSPVSASTTVVFPTVAPPAITAASAVNAARNTSISFTPTVTDTLGYVLSYAWAQTSGTAVEIESELDALTLVFSTSGALVAGESLVFELTVSDGINTPVTEDFTFDVAARAANPDTRVLNRSTFSGNIGQRNTAGTWSAYTAGTAITDFTSAKRSSVIDQQDTYLLISPASVLVQKGQDSTLSLVYHLFTPNPSDEILDAVHSDSDYTIVLTSAGQLLQYTPTASQLDTDQASAVISLNTITSNRFTHLSATPSFGGYRVIALWGTEGCLLLEISTVNFTVQSTLEISIESGMLYGANNVDFLRLSNVESLRSGKVLIGTVDSSSKDYETLIALENRSIIGTWSGSNLRNGIVTTGEILFEPDDSYSGVPLAPVLAAPTQSNGVVGLSWSQTRPDLITSYDIYMGADSGVMVFQQRVSSGLIQATSLQVIPGNTYSFQVQANSEDGPSPFSNTQQISV